MESPGLEMDENDVYPCKGCGEILEEGKAFELAGNRWHLDCFRCNTCGTLLDSDANLLLLGDGSLICNNCTYSCSACGNKIEDLAILTGDQAFCATCFKCRNCKRKIENLRYARTSQGIFCMSCHESLMARRRKKSKAAAQARAKEKETVLVDKSLPALPPSAILSSALNPDSDLYGGNKDGTTELSPRPRAGFPQKDTSSSRSSSRRPRSPEPASLENTAKDSSLTLPSTTYKNNRHSVISSASDVLGGDGEFYIPLALDTSPASTLTPRSVAVDPARATAHDRDYFGGSKNTARGHSADKDRGGSRERESNSQASTPHIALQEKARYPSSEHLDAQKLASRPAVSNRSSENESRKVSQTEASSDKFKLGDVPKTKKAGLSRSNSLGESPTSDKAMARSASGGNSGIPSRKEVATTASRSDHLAADQQQQNRSSQDSRPSFDSATSVPQRSASGGSKSIARKEIPSGTVKSSLVTTTGQDTSSSSASSADTPASTPTFNGQVATSIASQSHTDDLVLPTRSSGRPAPPQQKLSDSYMAPRLPPAPPALNHRPGKGQSGPGSDHPASPKLPRWSSGGDFTMDEDMARILGSGEEGSQSILRRVSNAVRHGRNSSEASLNHRGGHNRSMSETTRMTSSPRWPKTPILEDPSGISTKDISSPISIRSPAVDDPALLRRQLRNSEQRIAELERQFTSEEDLSLLNKKLIEKRKTVTSLDSQAELMVRELEVLTGVVQRARNSDRPLDLKDTEDAAINEFMAKFDRMKQNLSAQIEQLMERRDAMEAEKAEAMKNRDRALIEFEQLSMKNAQLADLNNDLTHQIQERFKAQSGSVENHKAATNGLGIYTHHSKAKSSTSMITEDSQRPGSGTTLQGSTLSNITGYAHSMEHEPSMMDPATVLSAPQMVNIRKGKANKLRLANVAKGVSRGFKGAFSSTQQERGQWVGQTGDSIGLPYDATQTAAEPLMTTSLPKSMSSGQGGFGLFKKSGTMPKTTSSAALENVVAEPPTKLFGSLLVERADFERAQIPSIVTSCIEQVTLRGMDVEGIYRKSGGAGQVKQIQDGFERSTEYDEISDPDVDIIAVTSALKQYFRKLPVPLLTFDVYDRVLESRFVEDEQERCDHLRETFNSLHPKHRDCLEFLIFHLNQVAERREVNKMHYKNIAVVFAPTIMHSRDLDREYLDTNARNDVVEYIIEHCYDIFQVK